MDDRPKARASDIALCRQQWSSRNLPPTLTGTVMDIGCWAGAYCCVALEKGADHAIGVDICRSPSLLDGFEFRQLDIMSDAALQLPQVEHVFLMGVLYHVHDPVGLLMRVRRLVKEVLWLETAASPDTGQPSISCFNDHTNWFRPNPAAVRWMLQKTGFEPVGQGRYYRSGRFTISAKPVEIPEFKPRADSWMPL